MFTSAPPFYSSVASGDHPAGDGLTLLQTAFDGAVSDDISSYARGPGTITESAASNVTVYDGYVSCIVVGAVDNNILWSGTDLGRKPSTGYTAEAFLKLIEVTVNPASFFSRFFELNAWNMANSRLGVNGYLAGFNALTAYATAWYTFTDTVDVYTKLTDFVHFAWVCDATANGDLRIYIAGQLVMTYNTGSIQKAAPYSGSIQIGGLNTGVQSAEVQCSGIRIRDAEMYTGSSFSPPGSPADWGPP